MRKTAFFLTIILILGLTCSACAGTFIVRNGDRNVAKVCLTMDDCYNIDIVRQTLDLCEQYNIKMTFFVVGKMFLPEDKDLWQEMVDYGCEIGSHTWAHVDLPYKDPSTIRYQMRRAQQELDSVLGYHYEMQVMRPPWGKMSVRKDKTSDIGVVNAIRDCGYKLAIKWDISQTNPQKALKSVKNGSILLFHSAEKDLECLKEMIPVLLERGYELCTVSNMFELGDIVITNEPYVLTKEAEATED